MKKSFTLIEILVVITVIGLLLSVAAVTYSTVNRSARDAKRKADLENIRAALEMYRSSNSYYPTALATLISPVVYIQSIPTDPLTSQNYSYQFVALPSGCNNVSPNFCTDYTVGALLENSSVCTTPPTTNCRSSPATACNYCVGAYGQK